MDEMSMSARRVMLSFLIDGHDVTSAIEPYLLDFTFTDNAGGKADSITLNLHDRDDKWNSPWRPAFGTIVTARITVTDWEAPGHDVTLPCGTFAIDELTFSGPPDKVTLKAVTSALTSGLRDENRTRAWENFSLQGLAGQVAAQNGLTLLYDGPEHTFARQDQREESDLAFVQRLAKQRGMNCKVHDGKLILFDAARADAKPGVLTISKRGDIYSPFNYTFTESSSQTGYDKAEVVYSDPSTGETYTAEVAVPATEQPTTGTREGSKTMQLNPRVESTNDAMRQGKAELREANEKKNACSLTIMGHPGLVAGVTLNLTSFGKLDGAYFVETATHKVDSTGYTTKAELRKTLGY